MRCAASILASPAPLHRQRHHIASPLASTFASPAHWPPPLRHLHLCSANILAVPAPSSATPLRRQPTSPPPLFAASILAQPTCAPTAFFASAPPRNRRAQSPAPLHSRCTPAGAGSCCLAAIRQSPVSPQPCPTPQTHGPGPQAKTTHPVHMRGNAPCPHARQYTTTTSPAPEARPARGCALQRIRSGYLGWIMNSARTVTMMSLGMVEVS